MSVFKWSTPERRVGDRILPIVPNEIYLHILDYLLPAAECPLPEELDTLARLSLVCRFFTNVCLPRIFEHVEFSGAIFRDDTPLSLRNDATYKSSRESTLCEQIAAKQPLALSLARYVKVCHFIDGKLDDTGSWAVRIFVRKYLTGLTHMKNIRRLKFSRTFVDMEHWQAIATLQSLEELCFDGCKFMQGPADLEPEKRVKVKASHLQVMDCIGISQPAAAIDTRFLRSITTDSELISHIDWTPQSSFKELLVQTKLEKHPLIQTVDIARVLHTIRDLYFILREVPRSLEVLSLPIAALDALPGKLLDHFVWGNWRILRSLTLRLYLETTTTTPTDVISCVLDGIRPRTNLQSLTISDNMMPRDISSTELRDILRNRRELDGTSSLKHLDIYGIVLQLVDGEWTEVPCNTT